METKRSASVGTCWSCGEALPGDATYCARCWAPLLPDAEATARYEAVGSGQPEPSPSSAGPGAGPGEMFGRHEGRRRRVIRRAASVAVVVALVMIAAVALDTFDQGTETTATPDTTAVPTTAATPDTTAVPTTAATPDMTAVPTASPPTAAVPGVADQSIDGAEAVAFVIDYYARVNAGEYEAMWEHLAPEFREERDLTFESYRAYWTATSIDLKDVDLEDGDSKNGDPKNGDPENGDPENGDGELGEAGLGAAEVRVRIRARYVSSGRTVVEVDELTLVRIDGRFLITDQRIVD